MVEIARQMIYPVTFSVLWFWGFLVNTSGKTRTKEKMNLKNRILLSALLAFVFLLLMTILAFFFNSIKGYLSVINEISFLLLALVPLTLIVSAAFSRKPANAVIVNPLPLEPTGNSNSTSKRSRVYSARQSLTMVGVALALFLLGAASLEMKTCGVIDRLFGSSGCTNQVEVEGVIFAMKYSPDGKLIALGGGEDAALKLYNSSDASLLKIVGEQNKDFSERIAALDFSPSGEWLASATFGGKLNVWRVSDGLLVQTLTIPKVDTTSRKLEFSPDGTLLVNAISGAGTQVWRVSDWQLVKEFAEQGYFSFTAAGQIVLEVADGKLQFMDTGNWSIARTLEGIKGYNLVFSPDNKLIATVLEGRTGPERTVAVYRVEDGKLLYQLKTYASHLVFSPDSRYLLTDSSKSWYLASGTDNENRLQIWNMANGQLAKEFGNYTFTIDKLAYSPSGSIAIQSFRYLTLWKPDLS